MNTDWNDLIQRYIAGRTSDEETRQLEAALKADDALADLYLRHSELDVALEGHAASAAAITELLIAPDAAIPGRPARWFIWRPLTAAAAGIAFGILCTSVVFGYLVPALNSPVTLLEESFEQSEAPQAAGVPTTVGMWSGDFAEITGAQKGVTPRRGGKMWRFLRADNAQATTTRANYVGEAMRVVDLKSLRGAGEKAGGQIEISAWFAQGPSAPELIYHWNIKAAAFQGQVTDAPKLWGKWDDASVCLVGHEVRAERSGRWQRVSLTMLLPANADFLVFECAVVQKHPPITEGVAEFPAHYLDEVRVRHLPAPHDGQLLE